MNRRYEERARQAYRLLGIDLDLRHPAKHQLALDLATRLIISGYDVDDCISTEMSGPERREVYQVARALRALRRAAA